MDFNHRAYAVCLIALAVLTGCGYSTLYSDLDEQHANEMLALLLSQDISARKSRADKSWQLEIRPGDTAQAMSILRSHGFPRDSFQSLGDVFRKEGFVSSPLEERARLLHALSQELSRTLSQIEGVIVARVHLAIPERNALSETRSPSSASIFIKHRADAEVAAQTASIKALVVNSVEELPYENVTVTFFPTDPIRLKLEPQQPLQSDWFNENRTQVATAVGVTLVLLLLTFAALRQRRSKRNPLPRAQDAS